MQRYLLDTNVLIYAIAGREPDASFLAHVIEEGAVALSVIMIAEFFTKASKREADALEELIRAFPPFVIDEEVARRAAETRKRIRSTGQRKLIDHLIAAQAAVHACVLVTHNVRDFPKQDITVLTPSIETLNT